MEIKGIIFDLDGVICNTDEYHYQAWKHMADDEGIYFDRKINEKLRGVSRAASLEIILEKADRQYSDEEKLEMMTKKNDLYKELLASMTERDVSSEVFDTLNALRAKGLKLAIGSSSQNTKLILSRIGLLDFFDGISDGTIISQSKPNPEVFIKAAGILQLKNENCFVVEDAEAGIDAAVAGGFHSIGIGSASSYAKAEYNINSFKEIIDLV